MYSGRFFIPPGVEPASLRVSTARARSAATSHTTHSVDATLTKSKRRSGTLRANQARQTYAQKGSMAGRPDCQCIAAAGSLLRPLRVVQPINNVPDGPVKRAEFDAHARTGDDDRHSNKGKRKCRKFLNSEHPSRKSGGTDGRAHLLGRAASVKSSRHGRLRLVYSRIPNRDTRYREPGSSSGV